MEEKSSTKTAASFLMAKAVGCQWYFNGPALCAVNFPRTTNQRDHVTASDEGVAEFSVSSL